MATTHLSYPFLFPNLSSPYKQRLPELFNVPTRSGLGLRLRRSRTQAMGAPDLLGDFGARDPFPAELESNFGEKVVGNGNTEHKILIPNLPALSLAQQQCQPLSPLQPPLSDDDIQSLLRKVSFCNIYIYLQWNLCCLYIFLFIFWICRRFWTSGENPDSNALSYKIVKLGLV